MRLTGRASVALFLLGLGGTAFAQSPMGGNGPPIAVTGGEVSNLPPPSLTGGLGVNVIDKDVFIALALGFNFDQENWGIGVQVPLRFRIYDADPKVEQTYTMDGGGDFGGLRREDWDQPGDYFKLLRYVYFGRRDKSGPFYVRIGELSNLSIGNGTIMHRYYNNIDANRWHMGLNAAVNIGAFGAEAVVTDLTDPTVAGIRFSVRPLMFFFGGDEEPPEESKEEGGEQGEGDQADQPERPMRRSGGGGLGAYFARKLVIGASLFTDGKAPWELAPRADDPFAAQVNDKGAPVVTRERALAILGVDIGLEVLNNQYIKIKPYIDFNKLTHVNNGGWGLHMGVLWNLRLPVVIDTLQIDLRTEYRRVASDYQGPYFNTTYEIERFNTLSTLSTDNSVLAIHQPKLRFLRECAELDLCGDGGRNGVYFDLLAGLPKWVFVGGEYVDYDGGDADGTLRLSLEVPALEFVRFAAYYYRVNIDASDPSDFFKLDDRSSIVASVSVPVYYIFSVEAKWWRLWQADVNNGGFHAVDDWSIGVGMRLEL